MSLYRKMDSIFNVLILLAEIPGFYIVLKKDGLKTFVYYTEIANLLASLYGDMHVDSDVSDGGLCIGSGGRL